MITYPSTKKVSQKNNYHGATVKDPYRWFEDNTSSEVKEWVDQQNGLTQDYLDQDLKKKFKNRLQELYNYERYSVPFKRGGNLFYYKNDGLQNQSVLYIKRPDKEDEVFLDPNSFSENGTKILGPVVFSHNGKYCAYSITDNGGDWDTYYFIDVETGERLPDTLEWIKEAIPAFYKDGVYYARLEAPDKSNELTIEHQGGRLFYHKLGTHQDDDKLVLEEGKDIFFFPKTVSRERFLVVKKGMEERRNTFLVKDLQSDSDFVEVFDTFDYDNYVVGSHEGSIFLLTTNGAENKKVILWNFETQESREIVSESDLPIEEVSFAGEYIFVEYSRVASSYIKVFTREGEFVRDLELPSEVGVAGGFSGDREDTVTYFIFGSTIQPYTIYELDLRTLKYKEYRRPKTTFDFEDYEMRQVDFQSSDGTMVPMFVTHKKGLELDGKNPCLMYAYGGFGITLGPVFSPSFCLFLEQGGVYAQPSIRGGGEFGLKWHHAAIKENRQVAFNDFIAAGEYLIDQGYTSPDNLAIKGGSNGGLLVATVMLQRPDLFGVALPSCGPLDMMRFHLFTEGKRWTNEYGSSDVKEEFDYLIKYSPVHNVKEGIEYSATLVTTGYQDDRVVPAHSYKFTAELQEKGTLGPYLLRVEMGAAHGMANLSKRIDEFSDEMTFCFMNFSKDNLSQ